MAPKSELILIFVLSLSSSLFTYTEAFDYFWHVQQWPPSICESVVPDKSRCSSICPHPELERFVIYGLWPQYSNGTYPIDCNGPPFDLDVINTTALKEYWPIVYGSEDDVAWGYAWIRHGLCAVSQFNQTQYFQTALKIRTDYDLFTILRNHGISPGTGLLSQEAVRTAISSELGGVYVGLRCKFSALTSVPLLARIVLCFDKDGTTIIDCPASADKDCPDSFYWPGGFNLKLAVSTDK